MAIVPNAGNKKCSRCLTSKSRNEFYRAKSRPDGLQAYCKDCKRSTYKQYRAENSERVSEKYRNWAARNPERRAETLDTWRANNRAHRTRYNRELRASDPSGYAQYFREYRTARADYYRAKKSAYRAVVAGQTVGEVSERALADKFDMWSGRCAYCSSDLSAGFHWDHWKPLSKGGAHMVANLFPSCAQCNLSKSNKWPFRKPGRQ